MMNSFKVLEGKSVNYFKALKELLGGEYTDTEYFLDKGKIKIDARAFCIDPNFEVLVVDAVVDRLIIQERMADDNPEQLYFSLALEGKYIQHFNNEKTYLEANTPNGIFLYNGLFPMKTEHPEGVPYSVVRFRTTKSFIYKLMPEAKGIIELLFGSNQPITYHTEIPKELESLTKDIFYYKEQEFGKNSMVWARSLELFTLLIQSVSKLNKGEKLHGLHIDDYERLIKIKHQLISDIEGKILVEDIASIYGISISKLNRDFRAMFNTTVYQFYAQLKMDEAFRRLKTGKFSVTEVSFDLGYNNISKFSQMFKKVKGVNPSDVIPV
ncbi:helix-turn-helix domain-containing protein [Saccharicrinis aurantiacus]|uniref:helix-turn-helix domain-containing protein n=1 Tax=Saccharicrinis aurantiacus TaxID=1849719 RepID=UPI0009F93049|nr:AraC family transcriptional regulator [Saccharicrinis aurantiacus]